MRISDLRSTTGFRLALFFLAVFGSASLLFVGTVYLNTSRYLSGNPDERMRYEAISFEGLPAARIGALLARHSLVDPTGRRPFGLFDPTGAWRAGNLRRLPQPLPAVDRFFETRVHNARENTIYRSFPHRLPDGDMIVVSRNIEELQRFRDELFESTLIGMLLMLVLGVAGSMVIARGSLRRLDHVTRAIERITRGDLSGRLPSRGTNDDTDRLVRVVNAMLDQIERLMGEVKGVCDSIAHDLRTPLTRLLAALERANRQALTDDERHAEIGGAIVEVRLMLRTFAALLRISEVEDGARRASFTEVDLAALAVDAVEYYAPAAEDKSIRLTFAPPVPSVGPLTIDGDGDLLFEALGNLIDNAIKFTPEGGRIAVTIGMGPSIAVTDTGCGIAAADRERVKLRFHRGTKARSQPGSGLGLPLVGAIARLHGLELSVDPVARGCRVRLTPTSPKADLGLNPQQNPLSRTSPKSSKNNRNFPTPAA